MIRRTLGSARAARIPESLNIPPNDARFVQYVNEAMEGMLNRGLWWGSYGRYSIAINSQLLTLPAEIDTIEALTVNDMPIPSRSLFYEFLGNGWGARDDTKPTGINEALFRGMFPTYVDVDAANPSVLNVKCQAASDAGKLVLLLGYDANNNWVRTQVGGVWQDGESVPLQTNLGTNSSTIFSRLTGVQTPPSLDGQWWLYQGITLLANYQYWETNPSYKRYLVPYASNITNTAIVLGKRAFVPVKNDSDYLILGNLRALKLACMACLAEEEHNWGESNLLWNGGLDKNGFQRTGAIQELDNELQHHLGEGVEASVTIHNAPGHSSIVEALI